MLLVFHSLCENRIFQRSFQTAVELLYAALSLILDEEWILHFASIFGFIVRTLVMYLDKYCQWFLCIFQPLWLSIE